MLSVILPTFNESENLAALMPLLSGALGGIPHEIIVVDDDSPDGTAEVARGLVEQYPQIRVLHRVGRRGLSSAVMEGFDLGQGDVLAVMDCDGQHDPRLLPDLYQSVMAGSHLAVASRYAVGGDVRQWGGYRLLLSRLATFLASRLPPVRVSDPMSGYFALRKSSYRAVASNLHPRGFKILLELLTHLPRGTRVAELPLHFGTRWAGESKLSLKVQMEFLSQLLSIALRRVRNFLWEAQWVLLFLAFLIVLALLLPSAWSVRRLLLSPEARAASTAVIRTVAEREGWLLSDITVVRVNARSVQIVHRPHVRGDAPEECLVIRLSDAVRSPCLD